MTSASFEEKSTWVQLVGMVLGLGAYFVVAGRMLASGVRAMPAFAAVFMVAVAAMVVFLIIAYALVSLMGKQEPPDERDRLIVWRSEYNSGWVVAAGVLGAVTCMVLNVENVWTANLLLLSLALSEVLGCVLRIAHYRRGV